jgi:hypothetical protein
MALRVFEDQIPWLRTGLAEFNAGVKLGVITDGIINTTATNAGFVAAIQAAPAPGNIQIFGDQQYWADVIIAGSQKSMKNCGASANSGPMSDTNCAADTSVVTARANYIAADPNLDPNQQTTYGQRNWDSSTGT